MLTCAIDVAEAASGERGESLRSRRQKSRKRRNILEDKKTTGDRYENSFVEQKDERELPVLGGNG